MYTYKIVVLNLDTDLCVQVRKKRWWKEEVIEERMKKEGKRERKRILAEIINLQTQQYWAYMLMAKYPQNTYELQLYYM